MTYEDLLCRLEDLVCDVVDRVLKSPAASLLYQVNPVRLRFYWQLLVLSLPPFFSLSSPPVDPSEVLSADPVDLQCVPMEAHFCPLPKLLMAAPVALNPVTLP